MIAGGSVRCAAGIGLAMVLSGASSVWGSETDCSHWLRAGREETQRADGSRKAGAADVLDHLEKAEDAFARARKDCPDSATASWVQVMSRLAYCRSKAGHFGDACDSYAELLKVAPGRHMDRALYADALEQSGHYQEAVEQLHNLILADPENGATFYCNVAMIYALDLGDGPQAVEAATKGLEKAGESGPCLEFAWGKGLALSGVGILETEIGRGNELLQDAKLKFAALLDDPDYGARARAEMSAIDERIHQGNASKAGREKR